MILESLITLATHGAEKPLDLWLTDYQESAPHIVKDLTLIASRLELGTGIGSELESCITSLKATHPDEFALASSLSHISAVFVQSNPDQGNGAVGKFLRSTRLFYGRAQTAALFKKERDQLKATLSLDQQQVFDLRLFQNEGMTYCLAFHLALYKAIQDAPVEAQKRLLIEEEEINLGFGGLPGLKVDFQQDEVLTKFILKILNDDLRNALIKEYYQAKEAIFGASSLGEVVTAFRRWLTALMAAFQKIGVDRFTSVFFKPYGEDPKLRDIKL